MFSKTRKKLTLFFATLMILFLISFNGIGYFVLSSIVYSEREREIQILADKLAEKYKKELVRKSETINNGKVKARELRIKKDDEEHKEEDDDFREVLEGSRTVLRPFYFILNARGDFVAGDYPPGFNLDEGMQEIKSWIPKPGEVRYLTMKTANGPKMNLLFSGRPVYQQEEYLGSVYTGAEISQQLNVLHQLMLVLAGLSVLFLLLSVFLGYLMSGRAMIPIIRAFNKQKQFVADASHELRTPISVIQASLEVLEAEEQERLQPFSKQVLMDLKDEVKRMSGLVAHMLTLARADSSEYELRPEPFSMNEELEKLYRKVLPLAEAKSQHLNLKTEPYLEVSADRERILQLLMILVDNAIQYTPENGTIEIFAKSQNGLLILAVSDNGIGIAKEKQQEIFERFYRGDKSRSRSEGNLGLGLSIAKWIVESHGGTIRIQSESGKGSIFAVSLPILRRAES